MTYLRALLVLAAAFAISACATMTPGVATLTSPAWLDDSDYARMEQPGVAYACALKRMGIDKAPGEAPRIVWWDEKWTNTYYTRAMWVVSEYDDWNNTIHMMRSMDAWRRLVWENTLAIQYQRGEEYNEREAKKNADFAHHCVIFGKV